ncbi:MAG: competence/damage-inducible protein A [Phycisphaerae bacterium]|nr:competence/damage-inducible protein A [Phycisphaerae bacterium]
MNAATLSIGDELALGQIDDTNARWLAQQLASEGVFRDEHRTVSDATGAIEAAIKDLCRGRALLVITGGLGPTADDVTRDALNGCCDPGTPLLEDAEARVAIEQWFRGRGRRMPPSNLLQALRPRSAACIANPHGTAPGLVATVAGARVFCLPGPPNEMQPMFTATVLRYLQELGGDVVMPTVAVHSFGEGESTLAERLGALMDRSADPVVGTTASRSIVTARIRSRGPRATVFARIDEAARIIESRWSPYAYGRDSASLAEVLTTLLREQRATVAVAESCTGGLLGTMITDVAGVSDVFAGGFIAYSNDLKERFARVPRSLLAAHGAVSEPVAGALAQGARDQAHATWGVGITGIAGPEGGSAAKPVGTVFMGIAGPDGVRVRRFQFPGDRESVRDRSAKSALQWLRFVLLARPDTPMLWAYADAPPAERSDS